METITSRQNPLCVQVRKLAAEGEIPPPHRPLPL